MDPFIPALLDPNLTRPATWQGIPREKNLVWLDKNENLDPTLLEFTERIFRETDALALATYPESAQLYQKLAAWCEVPENALMLTPGSDGAIRLAYHAVINPGDRVMHTQPTFAMYPVYSKMFGAQAQTLTYRPSDKGPVLTVEEVLTGLQQYLPKLFCLPNPDSPTGTVFNSAEMQILLDECARLGTVFLVDEAYHPFHRESMVPLTQQYPNLLLARTFSKAWGCAGLRVGYLIGHPEVMPYMHKLRPMYEVGTLSVAIMERIIDHPNEMEASIKRLEKGREALLKAIHDKGFTSLPTVGNFQHVSFGEAASRVHQALAGIALYRPDFSDDCLRSYSRFSLTTEECFTTVIEAIRNT